MTIATRTQIIADAESLDRGGRHDVKLPQIPAPGQSGCPIRKHSWGGSSESEAMVRDTTSRDWALIVEPVTKKGRLCYLII